MIKLIPCPAIDIDDLIKNVMSGRTYTRSTSTIDEYNVLHYDKSHIRSPFRYGLKPWDWRGITELKEITESHWYDNIPEAGVLCWAGKTSRANGIPIVILSYDFTISDPFVSNAGCWKYAQPILPSECYQEPV